VPTAEELTDPYLGTYTPVPHVRDGVCNVCHTATGAAPDGSHYARCWSCRESARLVSRPVTTVVPISLYRIGEQLHTVLAGYKRSLDATVRERFGYQIAGIVHRFLWRHRSCIEAATGSQWDTVTIVPSKTERQGPHPLEQAIRLGKPLAGEYHSLLTGAQTDLIGRARSSDNGFAVTENVAGRRILLIDDTFTSGATFQSAASTLALAGATVVAGVVIGRVIHTDDARFPERLELWERQWATPFSFETCCLEGA
jgi:predicted amidophosphoribosyltransferase